MNDLRLVLYRMLCWLLLLTGCDAAPPAYSSSEAYQMQQEADKKVQNVIKELKADCDTSLQKETYRRVQAQQWSVPQKHTP